MSTQITSGLFTSTSAVPQFLPFTQPINEFYLKNLTRSGVTASGVAGSLTSDRIVEAYFNPAMSTDTALIKQNGTVSGVLAPLNNGVLPQNGFTLFDSAALVAGPNVTINSFTPGTTTVFTTAAAHGFKVGDIVRIGSMTSAPQMGGLLMCVTAVGSTTTFTTLFNSSNAVTSVGVVYKVGNAAFPPLTLYFPEIRVIAAISAANPAVVTMLVPQNYSVGEKVRFAIPTQYGMQQLNSPNTGLPVEYTIRAVNNAVGTQTVTLDVDASGFSAFSWPGATNYPRTFPVMIPQGEGNINNINGVTPAPLPYGNQNVLGFVRQNLGRRGLIIGAGDGTNAVTTGGILGSTTDVWEWTCISTIQ